MYNMLCISGFVSDGMLSRIKVNELFTVDDNIKGTRGHSWKLA